MDRERRSCLFVVAGPVYECALFFVCYIQGLLVDAGILSASIHLIRELSYIGM